MEHKIKSETNVFLRTNKRNLLAIVSAVIVLLCVLLTFLLLTQPQRTVANFCQSAKNEKNNFKAGTNYDKLLGSFKKLDVVAPEDIRSDTSLIVKGYESIIGDPSKAVSSEIGISSSQMRVNDYITKNCPSY